MFSPRILQLVFICLYVVVGLQRASADRELHVVGIYEGVGGGSAASVYVDRPGQSVTLYLSSYDAVTWSIALGTGTTLERVFVSGYEHQSLQGLPVGVPVSSSSYADGTGYLLTGYTVESSRFLRAVPKIAALTNQEIASFHGNYQPPASGFTIDSVQNDPRLSSNYPQPVPLSGLPLVSFDLATYSGRLEIRHYRLNGPTDGGPLMNAGSIMDMDASGRFYYGGGDGLFEFDTQTNSTREIPLLEEIRQEGWQMGTAFDRTRGRALLVTLAGEGFLYGYSSAGAQWNFRVSMQNRDFDAITYHDADDSLYAVTTSHEDSYAAKIVNLTADGSFIKEIKLPLLPFDIGPGGYRAEIVSAGDYLALLLAPYQYWYWNSDDLPESRIYLIDPRNSEVSLTYRQIGPSNHAPTVSVQVPSGGTLVDPGSDVRLVANASDPDGTVTSVEFFVDGQTVGATTRDSATGLFFKNWIAPESGSHQVVAKAFDNKGAAGVSSPLTLTINRAPSVSITSPTAGSTFDSGSAVVLTARATDPDGSIASVVFTLNGQPLGTASHVAGTDTYTLTWPATVPGTYSVGAKATDNTGGVASATIIQITIVGNTHGTVRATRNLPKFYAPAKKLTVIITAKPNNDVTSYTVIDLPPAGWTVSAINSGGRLDAATGAVIFGPFGDHRPRALIYRVSPPIDAVGPTQFSGSVLVNGSAKPIGGDSSIDSRAKGRPNIQPVLKQPYE